MNTRIGQTIKNILTRRPLKLRQETPDDAANDADTGDVRPPSPTTQGTGMARAPRGPFKILTIPQAWYDSLHAGQGAASANDDTGKNE